METGRQRKTLAGLPHTRGISLLIGALIVIVCGAVLGRAEKRSVESTAQRLVRAFTVVAAHGGDAEFTGVIHARTESDLGFRVPGKIIEKCVQAGDHVKRGQALMRLDRTDLQLAANAAQAAVEAIRAQNKRALADELRQRELVAVNAISVQEYEQAKSAADTTSEQLNAAVANFKQLEHQTSYAVLRAEADGVVMETPADVGQVVGAGLVVVRLAHDGAREAVVNLPEGSSKLATWKAVGSLYAEPGRTFPATLRELSSMADPLTRTYQARYILGGTGGSAPLGATVTVRLDGENPSDAVPQYAIPIGALHNDGTDTSVWVIHPETSSLLRRAVDVAQLGSETALISNGLNAGERILALGAHLVTEGEKVKILPEVTEEHN
jgi:RND family efflux transporter MFP subunit